MPSVFGPYSSFHAPHDPYEEFKEDGSKDSFDAGMTEVASDPESDFALQLNATIDGLAGAYRLITDPAFGVTRGIDASQTAAIRAALDANPGKAFFFPAGNYRLDTTLTITKGNSLILHPDARIYAGAAMETLIDIDPPTTMFDGAFVGGVLDGVRLADRVMRIRNVSRHVLDRIVFRNGKYRGLITTGYAIGASCSVFGTRLMFENESNANAIDNIAMDITTSDSRFSEIVIRNWTVGVHDRGANWYSRVHPWLSADQIAARYENSISFHAQGNSAFLECHPDTLRYPYVVETSADGYASHAHIYNGKSYWHPPALGTERPVTYPSAIIDLRGSVANHVSVSNTINQATSAAIVPFVQGDTSRLDAFNNGDNFQISGADDYRNGVRLAASTFTPRLEGDTTAGAPTYTTQSGRVTVSQNTVVYNISLAGTLDNTVNGNLRVRGLPLPTRITSLDPVGASLGYNTGLPIEQAYFGGSSGGNGMTVTFATHDAGGVSSPVNGFAQRGKTFQLTVTVVCVR